MLPSLVYYILLSATTHTRNNAHSPFEMRQCFEHVNANVILVNQEWLKLGVALSCQRKYSIQQLLLATISTSLEMMMTSKN